MNFPVYHSATRHPRYRLRLQGYPFTGAKCRCRVVPSDRKGAK